MVKINIRDKNFGGEPSSCHNGTNKFVEWEFGNTKVSKSCFITDLCLPDVHKAHHVDRKIAWILEPRAIFPQVYDWIEQNNKLFDFVITFDLDLVNTGQNYLYYPHCRCWINNYIEVPKTKLISMFASPKVTTRGHQLRHEIYKDMGSRFDTFGATYIPLENKEDGLSQYYFSITIENSIQPGYWTEKIVDCFATKCVPIFWGDKSVNDHFNQDGIIYFNTVNELQAIIKDIEINGEQIYNSKKQAIEENFNLVENYRIPEDWVFKAYPFLFN